VIKKLADKWIIPIFDKDLIIILFPPDRISRSFGSLTSWKLSDCGQQTGLSSLVWMPINGLPGLLCRALRIVENSLLGIIR
jgi:hypothetical protein